MRTKNVDSLSPGLLFLDVTQHTPRNLRAAKNAADGLGPKAWRAGLRQVSGEAVSVPTCSG